MARIILVRHGQTEWNKAGQGRFRGRADLALDNIGIKQAEAIAQRITNCGAVVVYSSPLRRALMTAEPVARHLSLDVKPVEGLIDIDYGAWQGLSAEEAFKQDSDLHRLWLEHPHRVRFPDGESLEEVRNRILGVIDWILEEHAEQTVIAVSHVVVCRVFICVVLGLDNSHFWQIGQDVCAVNKIGFRDGRLTLDSLNDTCHLAKSGLSTQLTRI